MSQNHTSHKNDLTLYRLRMGFSAKYVSALLGYQNTSSLRLFEDGRGLPSLKTALKLAAVYRVPIDFLFAPMYTRMREEIRGQEEKLSGSRAKQISLSN